LGHSWFILHYVNKLSYGFQKICRWWLKWSLAIRCTIVKRQYLHCLEGAVFSLDPGWEILGGSLTNACSMTASEALDCDLGAFFCCFLEGLSTTIPNSSHAGFSRTRIFWVGFRGVS
jgi:hypothetical protein